MIRTVTNRVKRNRAGKVECSGDFETTTDAEDCRVWLWGLLPYGDPDNNMSVGTDIESFFVELQTHNRRISFHNLRFDGAFILDYALKNGYTHVETRGLEPLQIKSLISDDGKFYSITLRHDNGVTTEFVDSLKKLNMSVAKVAKSFKLEEGKGELDYDKVRPIGYQPTPEEHDYLRRDVGIMAKAMQQVKASGMTRLTVASDSLAEYKSLVGDKTFARMFPTLSYDMDKEIRRSYRGGFVLADKRTQLQKVGSGITLDVNSLYPSVMYNNIMPYGLPQWQHDEPELTERFPLSIFAVTFTAKLKPGHIPCIQVKAGSIYNPSEYLTEIKEPTTLVMTNVDLALYREHYDMDIISFEGGWRFRAAKGLFKTYIDKWSEIKATSEGGLREIAKLHLNALYGKFASNPNVQSKIPYIEDNRVKYRLGEPERRPPIYTAVSVFTTSYGRDLTIRAAQANYDTFAYADTDSLHLLRDDVPDTIDLHPSRMGAWKQEYAFQHAMYVRPKAYLEQLKGDWPGWGNDGDFVNRMAGVPERVSKGLTFDDIWDGHVLHGKMIAKSVPGGVVLTDVPYELKL